MTSAIFPYPQARLGTFVDNIRGSAQHKQDLARARPLFEAAAVLLPPDARTARSVSLLGRGLQLPEELCEMVASHLAPEAATTIELAFFAAFSPELQQTALREVHAAVMRQQKPTGLSWARYLEELSRLQLPRTDVECIYRVFAGIYPPALASVWPWREPALRTLVSGRRVAKKDRDEGQMKLFFSWAGQPCSHAMLRHQHLTIFVSSSANRHQEGWADSPYGTPNQTAFIFAAAGKMFDADGLQARGFTANTLTCVGQLDTSIQLPVLSDLLKAEYEVIEDHIPKFVPPRWTIGYKDVNAA